MSKTNHPPLLSVLPALLFLMILSSACNLFQSVKEKVTFVVPIKTDQFSLDAIIRVRLMTSQQMEIAEKQSRCVNSYDSATKTETISCPVGVIYQKLTPEEFVFPVRDFQTSITIASNVIFTGEKYQLYVGGKSADKCNSTSASSTGVANTKEMVLKDLTWLTTEMGCPKP